MSFGAIILGTVQFVKRMRKKLSNRKQGKNDSEIAGMVYARLNPGIDEICKIVCGVYDVSKEEMCVKGRKKMKSEIWPYIYRESMLEVRVMK